MLRHSLSGLSPRQLQLALLVFFIALAVPAGLLVYKAYTQLKWEAFHHYRTQAEEYTRRLDQQLVELVHTEELHSFTDFSFLNVAGDPSAGFLQRSPLSNFPVSSAIPGLLGYFQIDSRGVFSTPLLPASEQQALNYGVSRAELQQRQHLQGEIFSILSQNKLVTARETDILASPLAPATTAPSRQVQKQEGMIGSSSSESDTQAAIAEESVQLRGQAAFDRLAEAEEAPAELKKFSAPQAIGRLEELELAEPYASKPAAVPEPLSKSKALVDKRSKRIEQNILPQQESRRRDRLRADDADNEQQVRLDIFESEIDPFAIDLLDSGHFILYRKVWRDNQRYIQGAIIESETFFRQLVQQSYNETALSRMSNLAIAYQNNILKLFDGEADAASSGSLADELRGTLLYQTHISAPLDQLQFVFVINQLPAGPGGPLVYWLALILLLVLSIGFYLMYRLGIGQIKLARQQQNFVSAVSHELKTPLTSIRMYGEMLLAGWVDEDKKKSYYQYIHDESERLSRLITNVLQLARMSRNELRVECAPHPVSALLDNIQSKINSQLERAGFRLVLECSAAARDVVIDVDPDAFSQIIINLVDNAIKFSARAERKQIDIQCQLLSSPLICFTVRDYGPGIPPDQMKKIFRLFYRSHNELTRETVGTGIGLALVQQLVHAMHGEIDVVNARPGAAFRVTFPVQSCAAPQP